MYAGVSTSVGHKAENAYTIGNALLYAKVRKRGKEEREIIHRSEVRRCSWKEDKQRGESA